MANTNRGKEWEQKVKQDFLQTVPDASFVRIHDIVDGHKNTSKNICDAIAYSYPNMFLLECKSHKGNTFPFSEFPQYDRMLPFVGNKGVRVGVALWFREKDAVLYVPVAIITKMKQDGLKSVNIKTCLQNYPSIIEVPAIKKRVFMDCDWSILLNLEEGM